MMKKHIQKASFLILSLLTLTSCDSSGMASGISGTVSNALPNLWITLTQLGAFCVMVFIFFRFAYKPIKEKLKARREYIQGNIQESEKAKTEALKNQELAEKNVLNSRKEAAQIIAEANKNASASAQKILDQAQSDADALRRQGEKDALEIKKSMEKESHDEIVKGAIAASKEILSREIDEKDNEKVVNDFLAEMKDHQEKE